MMESMDRNTNSSNLCSDEKGGWWTTGILIGLVAVGAIVRLSGLRDFALSPDDLLHVEISHDGSLGQVWKKSLTNMHPPLLFFLLRGMVEISSDEIFLRSIAWLPGLATIPMLFFLGRRAIGSVGGVAMAFLATLGFGPMIVSQVIRQYSLFTLLVVVALYLALRVTEEETPLALAGYSLTITALTWLHYSAVIPLAGVGIALGSKWIRKRQVTRALAKLVIVHLLPIVSLAWLYLHQVFALGSLHTSVRQTYLSAFFPESFAGYAGNLVGLMGFFSRPALAYPLLILVVLGLPVLVLRGRTWLAIAVVSTFSVNLALTFLEKYPFGSTRHSLFLLPFVALPLGAAVEFLISNLAMRNLARLGIVGRNIVQRPWLARSLGVSILVASCALALVGLPKTRFLRRTLDSSGYAWAEFPVLRADYEALMATLEKRMRENDIVLTNQQTRHYFVRASGYRLPEQLSPRCQRIRMGRIESYFTAKYIIKNEADLVSAVAAIRPHLIGRAVGRIWLINIGWRSLKGLIAPGSPFHPRIVGELDPGGMHLYVLSPAIFMG